MKVRQVNLDQDCTPCGGAATLKAVIGSGEAALQPPGKEHNECMPLPPAGNETSSSATPRVPVLVVHNYTFVQKPRMKERESEMKSRLNRYKKEIETLEKKVEDTQLQLKEQEAVYKEAEKNLRKMEKKIIKLRASLQLQTGQLQQEKEKQETMRRAEEELKREKECVAEKCRILEQLKEEEEQARNDLMEVFYREKAENVKYCESLISDIAKLEQSNKLKNHIIFVSGFVLAGILMYKLCM